MTESMDTHDCGGCGPAAPSVRVPALQRALQLEYLTVSWNLVEGVVAVAAATAASSIALLAFGIDSFVECTSGAVMIWRLSAEVRGGGVPEAQIEAVERRAQEARRRVAVPPGGLCLLRRDGDLVAARAA